MKNQKTKKVILVGLLLVLTAALNSNPIQAQKESSEKVNINTATAAQLQTLPRIGEKVAERIITYRKEQGDFKRIEDLMKVRGIGEKIFNNLKDRITVGSTKDKK